MDVMETVILRLDGVVLVESPEEYNPQSISVVKFAGMPRI